MFLSRFVIIFTLIVSSLFSSSLFASENTHEGLALKAVHKTGIIVAFANHFADINKKAIEKVEKGPGLTLPYSDQEKALLINHLTTEYKNMILPMAVKVFAAEFTNDELKKIIAKTPDVKNGLFDTRLNKGLTLVQEDIKNHSDEIGWMVTLLSAEFACQKNPPKQGCPKRYYLK